MVLTSSWRFTRQLSINRSERFRTQVQAAEYVILPPSSVHERNCFLSYRNPQVWKIKIRLTLESRTYFLKLLFFIFLMVHLPSIYIFLNQQKYCIETFSFILCFFKLTVSQQIWTFFICLNPRAQYQNMFPQQLRDKTDYNVITGEMPGPQTWIDICVNSTVVIFRYLFLCFYKAHNCANKTISPL